MMSNILIGYTTNAGSTREIVDVMADEFRKSGHNVDVDRLSNNPDILSYDAIVIGAPIILGWHKDAMAFVKKHEAILAKKKVAYVATSLRLTLNPARNLDSLPLSLDPSLAADPIAADKLAFKERFTTVDHYVLPMVNAAPAIKPVIIAFFNGKLEMSKLNLIQKAFVRFIVQAMPGDFRNWGFIKAWSHDLSIKLAG
jgi:menaquinone-dependent protoporphyrinogen IX oxidase